MLEIGSVVNGTYKILNVIGQGGMSVVYLAMNERANKQWAIKEIRNDGIQNFEVVKQGLIVETDMLKKLDHPNLPRIIDVIDKKDTFLIVMDYIEGKPLNNMLKEYGAQSQEYVIEWARQLCHVLGYLHSRVPPIIYRDMKPSNVMLKPDGNVMLIDFGTAREFKRGSVEDTTCLGTQGYAAPEQFGGHGQTDGRTDIYCLGATLYHLVTGHNPAAPPYEMYPIRSWDPNLSTGLEEIILKCTQKNPADRYQNCNELLYALDHYNELDDTFRSAQKKKMITFSTCVGLTLLFGLGCLFGTVRENIQKSRSYESYLEQAQSRTTLSEKSEYYTKAISLNPGDSEGYLTMLEDYLSDEEFSPEEVTAVTEAYSARNGSRTNISLLKKDQDGYAEFCFQLGIDYFFKFKGTAGKTAAQTWFHKAAASTSKTMDPQKRKRAELYSRIGSYYEALGKEDPSGENENTGYSKYFKDLEELNQNEPIHMGNTTTALTLYNEIASQISQNALNFMSLGGVTEEEMKTQISKIEARVEILLDGKHEQEVQNLKNNIEEAYQNIEIVSGNLHRTGGAS